MTEQESRELKNRIAAVLERVAQAAQRAGKNPEDIILVAASKMMMQNECVRLFLPESRYAAKTVYRNCWKNMSNMRMMGQICNTSAPFKPIKSNI